MTDNTENKPIIETANEVLSIATKMSLPAFVMAGALLFSYLKHTGLTSLFQPSLGSSSGLVSLIISFGIFSFAVAFTLTSYPILIGHTLESLLTSRRKITKITKWQFLPWALFNIIPTITLFVSSYFLEGNIKTFIAMTVAMMANSFLAITIERNKTEKPKDKLSSTLIVWLTLSISQFFIFTPLVLVNSFAKNYSNSTYIQLSTIIIAWILYSIISSFIISEVAYNIKNKATKLKSISLLAIGSSIVFVIPSLAIAPYWFIESAAQAVGILNKNAQWYIIEKPLLEPYRFQINNWKEKITTDATKTILSEKYIALKGYSAYQFSDIHVLCPKGTSINHRIPELCIITYNNSLHPIGSPSEFDDQLNRSIGKY